MMPAAACKRLYCYTSYSHIQAERRQADARHMLVAAACFGSSLAPRICSYAQNLELFDVKRTLLTPACLSFKLSVREPAD